MEQPENNIPDAEIASEPSKWEGLKVRAISSAILLAVTIIIWRQGGWLFTLFILLAAQMMLKEWNKLTEDESPLWRAGGLFYTAVPCASLIWLRGVHFENRADAGMWLVLYLLLIVWATDIGAYFTGRKFGRNKLAPAISPGKTWEGLGGGMLMAALVGGLSAGFTPFPITVFMCAVMAFILGGVSQMGDLFESWVKRRAGVKDSGTLIPGHGGLLDRIDGLTFTVPLFALAVALSGMNI
jgi:phosphatidate cytidylyltransferase